MNELKLLIPKKALKFYETAFKNDPYAEFKEVIGDDNFMMLIIDEPITEDIENIAAAAEEFGWSEGWDGAIDHYEIKPEK